MKDPKNYQKLGITLVLSFILMYAIMFLNVNEPDHVYINMTRAYMTLLMICAMAVLMILRMPMMYDNNDDHRSEYYALCRRFHRCAPAGWHQRCAVYERYDSAPFDRDHDERERPHH